MNAIRPWTPEILLVFRLLRGLASFASDRLGAIATRVGRCGERGALPALGGEAPTEIAGEGDEHVEIAHVVPTLQSLPVPALPPRSGPHTPPPPPPPQKNRPVAIGVGLSEEFGTRPQ